MSGARKQIPPMQIELLGAPRVLRDGAAVRLPSKKCLAILAFLALEGRATRAKVASLLWSGDAEAVRRNLRRELHRLREAGVAELIVSDDDSLALADGVECDVARWLAAAEIGDAAQGPAAPLLDGLDLADAEAFDAWLRQRREELARRWVQAARGAAARLEAAGDPGAAVDVLERLIAFDALQEGHYAEAMRLHAGLGERGRALELYDRCRRMLHDELGLDPLPATAALAERIRAAERIAPLVARTGMRRLAAFEAPLVGRDEPLQRLRDAGLPVMLVEGEPGIGKSRLALEYALDRRPYLRLECAELTKTAALVPFVETLRRCVVDPALRGRLAALPAAVREELARLVPFEGVSAAAGDGPGARSRFLDALATAFAELIDGGTLVVEDLHWLDDSSLEVLDALVHRLGAHPAAGARLVATARSAELAATRPALELVRKLERGGVLGRIELAPLDDAATLQLVRELSGSRRGERFAERLQRATRGNPFFLLETLRFLFDVGELSLDEAGQWQTPYDGETSDYAELPVPPTLQQALLERVERLGPAARRLLETAALAGDPFSLDEVQPATALPAWDAMDAIERAVHAQLLTSDDDGYRYVHALARAAVAASLAPDRRRLIHKQLAATLQERRGRAGRIAFHLEAAEQPSAAVAWRLRAAEEAMRRFARTEALDHYEQVIAHATDPRQEVEARLARLGVRRAVGGAQEAGEVAADLAAIDSLLPGIGDEALAYRTELMRCMTLADGGRTRHALAVAQRLLQRPAPTPHDEMRASYLASHAAAFLGESRLAVEYGERGRRVALDHELPGLASIETSLTYAYTEDGRPQDAIGLSREALARLALAPPDDLLSRAHLLAAAGDAQVAAGRLAAAQAMFEEGLALAEQSNAPGMTFPFLMHLTILHAKAGQPDAARARRAAFEQSYGTSTNLRSVFLCAMLDAHVAIAEGRIGAALAALQRAIEVGDAVANPAYQRNARLLRARVHEDCRRFDAALDDATAAPGIGPDSVLLVAEAVRASAELAAGDAAAACARLQRALAAERIVDDHLHEARDFARCVRAEALLASGDAGAALGVLALPCGAPALEARALAVRLSAGDGAAADEAARLRSALRLAPLAELRLLRALAQCGDDRAQDAGAARLLARLQQEPGNAGLLARWSEAPAV